MYFVYTLSFNNTVFYVGCTKNPYNRYKAHVYCSDPATCNIVYHSTLAGLTLDFKIVHHSNDQYNALHRERFLIRLYSQLNNKLVNMDYNHKDNLLDKELMPKKLRLKRKHSSINNYIKTYLNTIEKYEKCYLTYQMDKSTEIGR